ncbi:MAG: glycosyltransferase family 4 protein [Flavobacteriaceae bacterium]|nr:glycosyltransferase family 4 protein [Flavobacteriaceae bacterium]
MRIGMILDKTFPPDPRVENEAIALIQNGHEVFLFCLTYENQLFDENYKGIFIKRYQSNKLIYKLSALSYTFPFYRYLLQSKVAHFIQSNNIEALHIHDITISDTVFKANSINNLPIVLDLHDNLPEIMKWYPHFQKFPGKYLISPKKWKQKEAKFIKNATKVITVSQEFIEEVESRLSLKKGKIVLVPNTVRESFYKEAVIDDTILNQYKNDFVILYLGDTGLRRGLPTAIAAMPELKKHISNIKLVIVGKNTTDSVLKEQVNSLNLADVVDFQGWQNVKLFPSYIKASAICISPLDRNIQHDVAYANKLFQYMSFGKPLLVSNATAQKNLVERTKSGLVHSEKNADEFADKVLQLYQNNELAAILGKNGKRFVEEEFCWEKVSGNLIKLYDDLG